MLSLGGADRTQLGLIPEDCWVVGSLVCDEFFLLLLYFVHIWISFPWSTVWKRARQKKFSGFLEGWPGSLPSVVSWTLAPQSAQRPSALYWACSLL